MILICLMFPLRPATGPGLSLRLSRVSHLASVRQSAAQTVVHVNLPSLEWETLGPNLHPPPIMLCQNTMCRSCYVLYLPIRLSGWFKLCLGQLGHHAHPKKETLGHTLKANNSALLRAPPIFQQSGECQLDNVSSLLRILYITVLPLGMIKS